MTANPTATVRAVADGLLISAFLTAVWLPCTAMMARGKAAPPSVHGEKPAAFPEVRLDSRALNDFPERFTAYARTNLAFRDTLIRWHGIIKVKWIGVSSSPAVVIGKNGWLFTNEWGVFWDYRGMRPFERQKLAEWHHQLQQRQNWLAARGIAYLVVIAPEACWTYPEYLPAMMPRVRRSSRMDELLAYMKAHSNVKMVDVRPALREAKTFGRLYHRTDAHWNELGAYFAYAEIIRAMGQWFPQLRPAPLSAFRITTLHRRDRGGNLARLLGLADEFEEERIALVPRHPRFARRPVYVVPWRRGNPEVLFRELMLTECPNAQVPRAVVFRDSYMNSLVPYFSEHFGRVTYSWTWKVGFDRALVERERPAVVIQEVAERMLLGRRLPAAST